MTTPPAAAERLTDTMPVFVLKAKDNLCVAAVAAYAERCRQNGLPEQASEVLAALDEIASWRARHPELCKWPDHKHAAAGQPGSGSEAALATPPAEQIEEVLLRSRARKGKANGK